MSTSQTHLKHLEEKKSLPYSRPYMICHMTPQLNLLLQKKKKNVKLLVSMRFGQRQTTQQKGVREGAAFSSLSFWQGNYFLTQADQELALILCGSRTWGKDPVHTRRTKMELQVIVNGNKKLEKTATSYINTTLMPLAFVCSAGVLYSSFHTDPVFFFTLSPTSSTGMPNANQLPSWSHPSKMQRLPPYWVSQSSSQCQLFTAPQFCSHKRLQFESCRAQVQLG